MAPLVELLRNALRLNVRDRAVLAEKLLASLEDLDASEAAQLWGDEAERRLHAFHSGRAKAVSARSVHRKAQKLLR